jgi:hypothetical protein
VVSLMPASCRTDASLASWRSAKDNDQLPCTEERGERDDGGGDPVVGKCKHDPGW